MRRIFLSAALLMAWHSGAFGFDCKKAFLPVDFVICSGGEVLAANEAHEKAWIATRARLNMAQKKVLLNSQRKWLKEFPPRCGVPAKGKLTEEITLGMQECVTQELKQQTEFLQSYLPQLTPAINNINLAQSQKEQGKADKAKSNVDFGNKPILNTPYSPSPSIQQDNDGLPIGFYIIVGAIVLVVVGDRTIKARKKKAEEDQFLEVIKRLNEFVTDTIDAHIRTLSLKRKQTLTHDDYGNMLDEKWQNEINYFIEKVLKKKSTFKDLLERRDNIDYNNMLLAQMKNQLGKNVFAALMQIPTYYDIKKQIIQAVDDYEFFNDEPSLNTVDIDKLSPIEFEHFCADILRANGWQAKVTQASGDQGIDIIADYNGKKAVFQCKKYSSPIGNKAVQEIIAGKQFSGANIAAVVSNTTYTASAKQLANTTGVYLLHYSELNQFKEKAVSA